MKESTKNKGINIGLRGSVTVEMAYVLPSIILMLLLIIYTVFYFHDKNILQGAAGETVVRGAQDAREESSGEIDLQGFYRERVRGKLILLQLTSVDVVNGEETLVVTATAKRRWMKVKVVQRGDVPWPEKKIQKKRWVESVANQEE